MRGMSRSTQSGAGALLHPNLFLGSRQGLEKQVQAVVAETGLEGGQGSTVGRAEPALWSRWCLGRAPPHSFPPPHTPVTSTYLPTTEEWRR